MGKHAKKKAGKPSTSDAAKDVKDVKSTPQAKAQTKETAEKKREEKKKKEEDPPQPQHRPQPQNSTPPLSPSLLDDVLLATWEVLAGFMLLVLLAGVLALVFPPELSWEIQKHLTPLGQGEHGPQWFARGTENQLDTELRVNTLQLRSGIGELRYRRFGHNPRGAIIMVPELGAGIGSMKKLAKSVAGQAATYVVDWPPGGKTMNLSAPGILEDALIQLLEEVVHPYHISPEEHDNLEYRLLVVAHGTSANIGMSLMQRPDAVPFFRPKPRSKPRGGLVLLSPALFWHGPAPTQQQFNLLKPNWPRIIIQRLVRPWLAYLPAAVALPIVNVLDSLTVAEWVPTGEALSLTGVNTYFPMALVGETRIMPPAGKGYDSVFPVVVAIEAAAQDTSIATEHKQRLIRLYPSIVLRESEGGFWNATTAAGTQAVLMRMSARGAGKPQE